MEIGRVYTNVCKEELKKCRVKEALARNGILWENILYNQGSWERADGSAYNNTLLTVIPTKIENEISYRIVRRKYNNHWHIARIHENGLVLVAGQKTNLSGLKEYYEIKETIDNPRLFFIKNSDNEYIIGIYYYNHYYIDNSIHPYNEKAMDTTIQYDKDSIEWI